jgi:hypothetical protein
MGAGEVHHATLLPCHHPCFLMLAKIIACDLVVIVAIFTPSGDLFLILGAFEALVAQSQASSYPRES